MEDDEEVQSQPSGGSRSPSPGSSTPPPPPPPPPSSSRSNGRITVTVASVPPQQTQSQNNNSNNSNSNNNTLTLALPIQRGNSQQQPAGTKSTGGNSGGGGGGGREDCWSEGATSILIDAWGERYLELSRGNLKQKHWKDVADIVSGRDDYKKTPKTDIQCKNRIDTVKKKYKVEKAKIAAGGGPSKWPFFDRLDHLIGPSGKVMAAGPSSSSGGLLPYSGSGGNNQRVPMGIPMMGVRSAPPPQFRQQKHQQMFRKRQEPDSDEDSDEESEPEPESFRNYPSDDFPPDRKRPRMMMTQMMNHNIRPAVTSNKDVMKKRDLGGGGGEKKNPSGNPNADSVNELTQAILKFGEAYEQAETLKLQQLVEMEKQRMKFAKDMELQRMQFFMKTQLELSQLKSSTSNSSSGDGGGPGRRVVGNSNNHHNHRRASNNNNTSDNNVGTANHNANDNVSDSSN